MKIKLTRKKVKGLSLVLGYLGIFAIFIGFISLLPLLVLPFFRDETAAVLPFSVVGGGNILLGLVLYFIFLFKRERVRFERYEDSLLLATTWILALVSGALPFFLAEVFYPGSTQMNFTAGFFEASSAYSTTGMTNFTDFVDVKDAFCPHVYCFHRSLMQFIGGCGLVLLLSTILGGQNGTALYVGEGHSDKLLPNLSRSAKLIFAIYTGYTIVGALALFFAGMDPFDAICHSMCALSGGGMSTRSHSVASFREFNGTTDLNGVFPCNAVAIEIIIMFLVVLSGISFVLHTFLLRGKWSKFFRDSEIKYMVFMGVLAIGVSFLAVCAYLSRANGTALFDNAASNLRDSAFYVVGSFTTSGFSNTSLTRFLEMGKPLLIICTILMVIGGGAGSCAGGIKMYRIVIMGKDLWHSIVHRFDSSHQKHPNLIFRYGKIRELDKEISSEAFRYAVLFIAIYLTSIIILTFLPFYNGDNGVEYAAFDVASAMSNTGLSMGDFHAYRVDYPSESFVLLWTLSVGEMLGRLEVLPFLNSLRCVKEEVRFSRQERRKAKPRIRDE